MLDATPLPCLFVKWLFPWAGLISVFTDFKTCSATIFDAARKLGIFGELTAEMNGFKVLGRTSCAFVPADFPLASLVELNLGALGSFGWELATEFPLLLTDYLSPFP